MTCEPRMHLRSDFQLLSAIDNGDIAAMASALKDGGGSPRSAALKLLLAIVAQREKGSFVLMPTRAVKALKIAPQWLRHGLPTDIRAKLIILLETRRVWVGVRRLGRRGPRADRIHFSKQISDGAEIEREIHQIAFEAATAEAKKARVGSVIPVVVRRGMKAQAIERFISRHTDEDGDKGPDERYAMKSLKAIRDLQDRLKS